MSQKSKRCFLPFSTPSDNRTEPFTKSAERATIFCLAELERSKGGRLAIGPRTEKIDFLAEIYYPLWLISLDETGLLFDGLATTSHTLTYHDIPRIEDFLEGAKRNSKSSQAYMAFLTENLNYFQISDAEEKRTIDGLITDSELLNELTERLTHAEPIDDEQPSAVKISPTLDEGLILANVQNLKDVSRKFSEQVKSLCSSMRFINKTTENLTKTARNEIQRIRGEFQTRVNEHKSSFEKGVRKIREEYTERVTELSKDAEDRLLKLEQDRIKLERVKDQLSIELERCETDIKICSINKDTATERRYKEERDRIRTDIAENESRLKQVNSEISETEKDRNLAIFELKSTRHAREKEVMKDLIEVESQRDARIKIFEEKMEKLEELTSKIVGNIDNLVKLREGSIDELSKLGFHRDSREFWLIYIPSYMVSYRSGSGRRYRQFPPSVVSSVSFSVKFRGALRRSRIKQLLQFRSKKTASFLSSVPRLMQKDVVFGRELSEACLKANVLGRRETRNSIKIEIQKLGEEGWLSERDCKTFIQTLV